MAATLQAILDSATNDLLNREFLLPRRRYGAGEADWRRNEQTALSSHWDYLFRDIA
jgi:hypothetical protein